MRVNWNHSFFWIYIGLAYENGVSNCVIVKMFMHEKLTL